jgi:hypothetical protein
VRENRRHLSIATNSTEELSSATRRFERFVTRRWAAVGGPWRFRYCRERLWVVRADGTEEKEQQDMKKWKRYRSLRRLVVSFAAVAVAVPVAQVQAQATQQDPGFTQASAQTAKSVYGIPVDSYRRLPADDQEALRPPRSVAIGGYSPSAPTVRTSTPVAYDTSATFSWGDAGIWAASGLVLMSFAVLGVLLVLRGRMGQPAV